VIHGLDEINESVDGGPSAHFRVHSPYDYHLNRICGLPEWQAIQKSIEFDMDFPCTLLPSKSYNSSDFTLHSIA
jgi:hypothetical protein